MPKPAVLPEEVFHAIAALIPRLIYLAEQECEIEPIDLLVLWHIRHFGKTNRVAQNVILRRDLTHMLKRKFRLADSDISKMLDDLQDRGFVERTTISSHERQYLFGDNKGQKQIVVLTVGGSEKIEQFKTRLIARYGAWLPSAPAPIRFAMKRMLPIAINFAQWLVKRYEPERSEMLYGGKQSASDAPSPPPMKSAT